MWQFLARCVALKLDPFSRQMYFIKRRNRDGTYTVSHQVGIDGFRSIAERTSELVGISEPEFEGEIEYDGKKVPALARVRVIREIRGKDREFVGVARFSEFVPASPNDFMWKKSPHNQLGKCAEAQAHRRAFAQLMGGLSTDVETTSYEGMMAAADAQRFTAPHEAQYIEVTDTKTGEMKQVRAGDEYERLYGEQEQKPEPTQVRRPDPEAYDEGNATERRASASLSEVIDAPPDPPDDDASDSLATNEVEETEDEPRELGSNDFDYGLCQEIYASETHLTLSRPLARQKPDYYADWHAKYVKAKDEAGELPF